MKTRFASEITEGEALRDTFLVTRRDMRETKHGKPYLSLELADRTGRIEARIWERAEHLSGLFAAGDYVLIEARSESFQGAQQLNVSHVERVDPHSVDPTLFLPSTSEDVERLFSEMLRIIDTIHDQGLRDLVKTIITDGEVARKFRRSPAAQGIHHAALGGLLQHTMSMLLMADRFCGHYTMLDRDQVIAGTVLHDIGKIDELSYERSFDFTDTGRLLGHITLAMAQIDDAARDIKVDQESLLRLKHTVLSHHGAREFGSPVLPSTPEALLIHFLDNIDSKLNLMCGHIESELAEPGGFTSFNRYMERSFYKGPGSGSRPYGVAWPWPGDEPQSDAAGKRRADHAATSRGAAQKGGQRPPGLFDKKPK